MPKLKTRQRDQHLGPHSPFLNILVSNIQREPSAIPALSIPAPLSPLTTHSHLLSIRTGPCSDRVQPDPKALLVSTYNSELLTPYRHVPRTLASQLHFRNSLSLVDDAAKSRSLTHYSLHLQALLELTCATTGRHRFPAFTTSTTFASSIPRTLTGSLVRKKTLAACNIASLALSLPMRFL